MKKVYLAIVAIILFLSCTSNSVTDADLVGKTFQAKHDLGQVQGIDAPEKKQFADALAMLNYTYSFHGNGSGTYTALDMEMPFEWKLTNDSLTINIRKSGLYLSDRYHIKPNESGIVIHSDSSTIDLLQSK